MSVWHPSGSLSCWSSCSCSGSVPVKICAGLAIAGVAALLACSVTIRKNGGVLTLGGESVRLFSAKVDYRLVLGVPVLCLAAVAASMAVPTAAFYATWLLAIVSFVLAVYYTIKSVFFLERFCQLDDFLEIVCRRLIFSDTFAKITNMRHIPQIII